MSTEETKPVVFSAYFPNTLSAIKIHGGGDGFRIQLEVPQTERDAVRKLEDMVGVVLKVAVLVDE